MEYPILSLSATSIGMCEQGVTPFYDIVWSFDYYLENINAETEFGFLFFLQDGNITPTGGTPGPGLGYSQGLDLDTYVRPSNEAYYFRPDSVGLYKTIKDSGLNGALLGVGFDSTGCYALSVTYNTKFIRDGKSDNDRIPNSVAVRGGAPNYSYNQYSTNFALTNFNIIDSVKKTVRARLGNLGRTIYIDYRNTSDQDFIPLLTQDIDLGVSLYNYVRPGVTFTKNISSSSTTSAPTVVVENFHFEGKTEIPILDTGTNLPQLSVTPIGPPLAAVPPEDPGIGGEPPTIPWVEECKTRTIKTIFQDGSIAPNTTVTIDGSRLGITNVAGILYCKLCNGYKIINGFSDNLRGTVDVFISDSTGVITIVLSKFVPPTVVPPVGPAILPVQGNTCTTATSIISAYIAGCEEQGMNAPDLYNYGYAIRISTITGTPFNEILYRVEPFRYANNNNTLSLILSSFNDYWILTDSALNRYIGQMVHPVGNFIGDSTTLNLSYYNE